MRLRPLRTIALASFLLVAPHTVAFAQAPFVVSARPDPSAQTMEITGFNFGTTPVVFINFQPATVQSASATTIRVELPILPPGTYSLIVISGGSYALSDVTIGAAGSLTAPAAGVATAASGFPSRSLSMTTSLFNAATMQPEPQTFQWRALPIENNTSAPRGQLTLHFGAAGSVPVPTGFAINTDGTMEFAPGQTFPGMGDVSGVNAGTGLTGGGASGDLTLGFDTAFGDARYARLGAMNFYTTPQHVNNNMTVTGEFTSGRAVFDANSPFSTLHAQQSGSGHALSGTVTSPSGTFAIAGRAASEFGGGLIGEATSATGPALGVWGLSSSQAGTGVWGSASSPTGATRGVMGTSNSADGVGVLGEATSSAGGSRAVAGLAYSPNGTGVWGRASSTTGATVGVDGATFSPGGIAVRGISFHATGATLGVFGRVDSTGVDASAVFGHATAATGETRAIRALNESSAGTGVWVRATSTTGSTFAIDALAASTSGVGIRGNASAGTGSTTGVIGMANSTSGIGVKGDARATAGFASGVYGITASPDGEGVWGDASPTSGFSTGVRGTTRSTSGSGVVGNATAATGFNRGVYGFNVSDGGVGVHGLTISATGQTVGVLGETQSAQGTAGIFDNEAGGRILAGTSGAAGLRFRVEGNGNVFADGSYNCGLATGCFNAGAGADLAERIDVTESLEAGDVVEIDPDAPERFRRSRAARSTLVAGIVSTAPAVTLANNDLADNDTNVRRDERPLLALAGRVPVKVTDEGGPIRIGDLLISSPTPGYAMRCADSLACIGAVVGKALEAHTTGRGSIKALVTLQ